MTILEETAMVDFWAPIRVWIYAHWLPAYSILVTLIALIPQAPKYIDAVQDLYRRARNIPSLASVEAIELVTDSNPRFAFQFDHPKIWDRMDPSNSDGSSYSHPKYPNVRISVWGGYNILDETLDNWVTKAMSLHKLDWAIEKNLKQRLIVDSGKILLEEKLNVTCRTNLNGKRVVYDVKIDNRKYRAMQIFVQVDNRQLGIRCIAPTYLFESFEFLFLKVCNSLIALNESQRPARMNAVLEMLRELNTNECAPTAGLYAGLMQKNPNLLKGMDESEFEAELHSDNRFYLDLIARGWSCYSPESRANPKQKRYS